MEESSVLLWVLAGVLTFTGLAGMLLPLIPGAPLLFLGLVLGAWADGFRYVGGWTIFLLAVMAALTYVVEFAASVLGAGKFGGSKRAMAGAAIGAVIGLFLGLPGILLGPFIGAVLGELSLQRTLDQASRAGFGTVVGLAVGVAGKLAIGMAMIGVFVFVRFF